MAITFNNGANRTITDLFYQDATALRTIQKAWYNDGTATRLVYQKASPPAGTVTLEDMVVYVTSGTKDRAGAQFDGGDDVYEVRGNSAVPSYQWLSPDGVPSDFEVMFTRTGGVTLGSVCVEDVWYNLGAQRAFYINGPAAAGTRNTYGTYSVRRVSTGVVEKTALYDFTSERF